MIKINKLIGRHYDLTTSSSAGLAVIPVAGKIDITYSAGLPVVVLKYNDSSRSVLMYTTNITWDGAVPVVVSTQNHSSGLVTTTTLTWVNGQMTSVDKIIS